MKRVQNCFVVGHHDDRTHFLTVAGPSNYTAKIGPDTLSLDGSQPCSLCTGASLNIFLDSCELPLSSKPDGQDSGGTLLADEEAARVGKDIFVTCCLFDGNVLNSGSLVSSPLHLQNGQVAKCAL